MFARDASTYSKFWRTPVDPKATHNPLIGLPQDQLKTVIDEKKDNWVNSLSKLRSLSTNDAYNEILMGVSKEALVGIFFSTQNSQGNMGHALRDRLTAKARQQLVHQELKILLPILGFDVSANGGSEYTNLQFEQDINALKKDESPGKDVLEGIKKPGNQDNNVVLQHALRQLGRSEMPPAMT